jgi:hypothetical protein
MANSQPMNNLLQWVIPGALVTVLVVGVLLSALARSPDRGPFKEAHKALEETVGSPVIALAKAMDDQ